MSKEKSDFNLVYDEACKSVGLDDGFVHTLLDTNLKRSGEYLPTVTHLAHPFAEAWVESDFVEIERVRRLGRYLVEDTKSRFLVRVNSGLTELPETTEDITDFFMSRDWYDAHPNEVFDVNRGRTSESAFPRNIAEFPDGGYVNCLGASIGMAALIELIGIPYRYASSIRSSSVEVFKNFFGLEKKIKRHLPGAYELNNLPFRAMQLFELLRKEFKGYEPYAGMPLVNPRPFDEPPEEYPLDDYHHFLIADTDSGDLQIDPYSITHAFFQGGTLPGNTNYAYGEVELVGSDLVRRLYDDLNDILDEIIVLSNDNNSLGLPVNEAIERGLRKILLKDEEKLAKSAAREYVQTALIAQRLIIAEYLGMEEEREAIIAAHLPDGYGNNLDSVLDKIDAEYEKRVKYDNKISIIVNTSASHIPIAAFMQFYRQVLMHTLQVKDFGTPNSMSEIGETDFTIGAMFLNHYANNRKDGRINVARYLSRYTSSQLIWLAAMCDGESEEDPSMQAVGEQVKVLKPSQMHPRVHLVAKH